MKRTLSLLTALSLLLLSVPASAQLPEKADFEKFVFFATLEGLYELSLPDDVVEGLLKIDPSTGRPEIFVYACPICHPVYNALNLYKDRPVFLGSKPRSRDFSKGEDAYLLAGLSHPEKEKRALALRGLVEQLVARKFDKMRLTTAERQSWQGLFAAASKEGNNRLESYPEQAAWMKECPSCTGASSASKVIK